MNAKIGFKYIAKDYISIHEVRKKLLSCAQFGECAFCGDKVRALFFMAIEHLRLRIIHIACWYTILLPLYNTRTLSHTSIISLHVFVPSTSFLAEISLLAVLSTGAR